MGYTKLMKYALFLLFVLFLASFIKINKKIQTPFDLKHTLPLRGILAMLVVFGHLDTIVSPETKLLMPLHMSSPAVAVFFFMSGYGLIVSYAKKG